MKSESVYQLSQKVFLGGVRKCISVESESLYQLSQTVSIRRETVNQLSQEVYIS
jgi:hypothetical protein